MSNDDDDPPKDPANITPAHRPALWIVLGLNVGDGLVEMVGGYISGSQALKADALDFLRGSRRGAHPALRGRRERPGRPAFGRLLRTEPARITMRTIDRSCPYSEFAAPWPPCLNSVPKLGSTAEADRSSAGRS